MSKELKAIFVHWTTEDIKQIKPEWDEEKCIKFLTYVKKDLIHAAESAGNEILHRVLKS